MANTLQALRGPKNPPTGLRRFLVHLFRPYSFVTPQEQAAGKRPRFRFLANAIEVWGLQALLFLILAWLTPHFFHAQMHSAGIFFLTFLALAIFVVAPGEWFFHLFMMHRILPAKMLDGWKIVPEDEVTGVRRKWRHLRNSFFIQAVTYVAKPKFSHGAHHKKTDVTPVAGRRAGEQLTDQEAIEQFYALSRYEIVENESTEHATFPHFSLIGFWAFFGIVTMLPLQLIFNALHAIPALHVPYIPIVCAMTVALTWQVWVYEGIHAMMHMSYRDFWKPLIALPVIGPWFSMIYRFHFEHHMNESCSLGVVGALLFWYVTDQVFGTYKLARPELIESASHVNPDVLEMSPEEVMRLPEARPEDFDAPPGRRAWVIRLQEHSDRAEKSWNGLFVQAFREVERRKRLKATAG